MSQQFDALIETLDPEGLDRTLDYLAEYSDKIKKGDLLNDALRPLVTLHTLSGTTFTGQIMGIKREASAHGILLKRMTGDLRNPDVSICFLARSVVLALEIHALDMLKDLFPPSHFHAPQREQVSKMGLQRKAKSFSDTLSSLRQSPLNFEVEFFDSISDEDLSGLNVFLSRVVKNVEILLKETSGREALAGIQNFKLQKGQLSFAKSGASLICKGTAADSLADIKKSLEAVL